MDSPLYEDSTGSPGGLLVDSDALVTLFNDDFEDVHRVSSLRPSSNYSHTTSESSMVTDCCRTFQNGPAYQASDALEIATSQAGETPSHTSRCNSSSPSSNKALGMTSQVTKVFSTSAVPSRHATQCGFNDLMALPLLSTSTHSRQAASKHAEGRGSISSQTTRPSPFVIYRSLDCLLALNEESHFLSSEESPLELGVYVSAFGVSSQAIVLGRMDGAVNVLTHEGIMVHQWKNHKKEVTALSFNRDGTYLGSCSVDCQIFVYQLEWKHRETKQLELQYTTFQFSCPSVSSCLELFPSFSTSPSTRMMLCCTDRGDLLLYHKTHAYMTTACLHSGEGRITKIAWNPTIPLVAWANEVGVKVLDVISKEKISFVPYHEQTRRIQKQNPWLNASLLWLNEVVLVMGYGTIIQVGELKRHDQRKLDAPKVVTEYYLELVYTFSLPHLVYGIGQFVPLGKSHASLNPSISSNGPLSSLLCALTSAEPANDEAVSQSRQTMESKTTEEPDCVVSVKRDRTATVLHHLFKLDGSVVASDSLWLEVFYTTTRVGTRKKLLVALASCETCAPVYIVGSTSVLQVALPSFEDRAAWYLGDEQYEAALKVAEESENEQLLQGVACLCLRPLLDADDVGRALMLLSTIRFKNAEKEALFWRHCVALFDERRLLHRLLPFLPTLSVSPVRVVYVILEDVFCRLARSQPSVLHSALSQWFEPLLGCSRFRERCIHHLQELIASKNHVGADASRRTVQQQLRSECLGVLLDRDNKIDKAFILFLDIGASDMLFSLIESRYPTHPVLIRNAILSHLPRLMSLNLPRTIAFLADHSELKQNDDNHVFPVTLISQILKDDRRTLFCYLRGCYTRNPAMLKAFHGQYMSLLAEFSPEDCLEFLQQLHLFKTLANPSYMLAVCRRRRKEIESVFQQNGFAQTVQQCCSVQHDSKSDSEVLLEGEPDSLLMGESANSLGLALTDLQTSEVFLYYVMGRLKEALHVLLYKLKDIVAALDLVAAAKDPDLWDMLLDAVQESPEQLEVLFRHLDEHQLLQSTTMMLLKSSKLTETSSKRGAAAKHIPLAPVQILRRLPSAAFERVPSVHRKLAMLFRQLAEQDIIHALCVNATVEDYDMLGDNYVPRLQRGVAVQWIAEDVTCRGGNATPVQEHSPGGWAGFFLGIASDIELTEEACTADELHKNPVVASTVVPTNSDTSDSKITTNEVCVVEPSVSSVFLATIGATEVKRTAATMQAGRSVGQAATLGGKLFDSLSSTPRSATSLPEKMVTVGRSLVNSAGTRLIASLSTSRTPPLPFSAEDVSFAFTRLWVSQPSTCSVCWKRFCAPHSAAQKSFVSHRDASVMMVFHCDHVTHKKCHEEAREQLLSCTPSHYLANCNFLSQEQTCCFCAKLLVSLLST